MRRITIFIIIFVAIIGIIGFYYQKNIYSKDILKLEILGPDETDLLEEVEYVVKYKNNGDTLLEEPELVFEYPKYSVPVDETSLRIVKKSEDLGGGIYPGEEKTFHFKTRLLGKEGETREAHATLTYKPKNLKASYTSETTFTTIIKKVPLTLGFDLPSDIESGKNLNFKLNYFSNTDYPLSNLSVILEYPSDFEFISSNPESLDKTEWDIGLLNKAEGGRIEISGKLGGEVGEEKVFRAKIGSWQDGEFILLKEVSWGITIVKPALRITQSINGNPEFIASAGENLHYEIFFKNIGDETLTDLSLVVTLTGPVFDFSTVRAPSGEYTAGDNSIIWDWRQLGDLQLLSPQEEGKVEFWIKLKNEWEIQGVEDKNPTIKTNVYLSQVKEEFVNKVNSALGITQKGYFQDEVFGNSGPVPPSVGEDTTYTILWQAKNYYNEMKNVKVKATLPDYVKLTGKIFPEEEAGKFTFDSNSRELVWSVGDLMVAQGILSPAPNIAFQIVFTPTASQRGQSPAIIGEAEISGEDSWTGETSEATAPSVNTTLPDDETVNGQQGIVK